MKPDEIAALAKQCRELGITHFKSPEVELVLGDAPAPPATEEELNEENIAKVQALTSLLKLKDEDLVDRMFPTPNEGSPEVSA